MTKRLPKTANRTMDDLRSAASTTREQAEAASKPAGKNGKSATRTAASPPPRAKAGRGDAQKSDRKADTSPQETATTDSSNAVSSYESAQYARAQLIIERHSNFGAIAGLIPMPWIDLTAITLVVERMLRQLANLYSEPLSKNQSKRLATAMLTGMAAPGIASFTTTGLMRMLPGPNVLSIALTSISANILIRAIGDTYADQLESKADTNEGDDPTT
jgi:uncharacterized protein (DUF697 family)